jgi:hypothetical protein
MGDHVILGLPRSFLSDAVFVGKIKKKRVK